MVAQELVGYSDPHRLAKLYYWHRESRSSNAEVDFVIMHDGDIMPVEVKSSKKGSMKSIQMFLDSHPNTKLCLKISEGGFARHNHLIEIPLYALDGFIADKT